MFPGIIHVDIDSHSFLAKASMLSYPTCAHTELGDLLFDVFLLCQLASRDRGVTLEGACERAVEKVQRRTPYMGWRGQVVPMKHRAQTAAEASRIWQEIKRSEKPEPMPRPTVRVTWWMIAVAMVCLAVSSKVSSLSAMFAVQWSDDTNKQPVLAGTASVACMTVDCKKPLRVSFSADVVHNWVGDDWCDQAGEGDDCPERLRTFVGY